MKFYLGIDGGQSATECLIGDETGRVIGSGTAGPCNHVRTEHGRYRFVSAITESLRGAMQQAELVDTSFAAACLGLSGGPEDKDFLARELIRAERYLITHDAMIALAGASGGRSGIVVIAGTGSIAFGRNDHGQTARAGGWGYVFGDEGSAFDIVRQALRAALRQEEGWGPATALRQILIDQCDSARNANDVLHRFYTPEFTRAKISALAPLVDEAARGGDGVAQEILSRSAQELATIVGAVRRQLFRPGEPTGIHYIGGVFQSAPLLARFRLLIEMAEGATLAPPRYKPAEGALIEAYRIDQAQVTLQR